MPIKQSGFILLSLTLYILVVSLLSGMVLCVSSNLLLTMRTQALQTSLSIASLHLQSLLKKIIDTMPLAQQDWVQTTSLPVWRLDDCSAGFKQTKNNLWWVKGVYNPTSKRWGALTKKLLIFNGVSNLAWTIDLQAGLVGCTGSLHYRSASLEFKHTWRLAL